VNPLCHSEVRIRTEGVSERSTEQTFGSSQSSMSLLSN